MTPRAAALAALERALAEEPNIDEAKACIHTAEEIAGRYTPNDRDPVITNNVYGIVFDALTRARSDWRGGIPLEPLVGTVVRNSILSLKGSA